ncbi:MAG: cupin domain-containing protein [Alphaproteobacteria bacterium]
MSSDQMTAERDPAMKLAISAEADAEYVDGRRAFFKYRDLGVTDATGGRMRAQVTSAEAGLSEPTGWHYHTCEMQFVYMLEGWVELEFEDGRVVKYGAGDSVMIPGGERHQEIRTSESMRLLEVSVPAEMGTVPCDPPSGAAN